MFIRQRAGVGAALATLVLSFGMAGTAAAEPPPDREPEPGAYTVEKGRVEPSSDGPTRAARAAAGPPPCVTATQDPPGTITQTVRIRNGCAAQQRVKVLVKYDLDSECFILDPGGTATYAVPLNPAGNGFDGLAAC